MRRAISWNHCNIEKKSHFLYDIVFFSLHLCRCTIHQYLHAMKCDQHKNMKYKCGVSLCKSDSYKMFKIPCAWFPILGSGGCRDVARRVPTPMPIARSANGAKTPRVVREGYTTFYIFFEKYVAISLHISKIFVSFA